ncbi:MAG: LPS export ABC transporter permease LptF [Candidatus Nanoarchaeia archaeon]|nr:LPS export ABC transporter permease LptF [Candidatus Nanoarchaeia archaeon]
MKSSPLNFFKYKNTLIARYIRRNVVTLFIAIIFIIGLVVFGNQFVLRMQESIEQGFPIQEVMSLISYNMIRDFPLIFSLSLFLAIILAVTQLYKNSEAIVMNSLGLGDKHFIVYLRPLVTVSFLALLFLTTTAVPWSKQQKNIIEEENKNASEFSFIKEGEFEEFQNGEIVFYASESSTPDSKVEQNMEEIFISARSKENSIIVLASEATKYSDPKTNNVYLRLKNGTRYQDISGSENKNILNFDQYNIQIISGDIQNTITQYTAIEGIKTLELLKGEGPLVSAELQWRLSSPIGLLILSVLGVLLGKASPRSGKSIGLLIGVIIFLLYNNGLLIAKNSVERGELNPIIGLWSVHLLLLLLTYMFYQFRNRNLFGYLDKISIFTTKKKKHA